MLWILHQRNHTYGYDMKMTFVVWNHAHKDLEDFLAHLNSRHENLKFSMELEKNVKLPFLDVLLTRKTDCLLGHSVYCKLTHTDVPTPPGNQYLILPSRMGIR